jgi:hypothetical protein
MLGRLEHAGVVRQCHPASRVGEAVEVGILSAAVDVGQL